MSSIFQKKVAKKVPLKRPFADEPEAINDIGEVVTKANQPATKKVNNNDADADDDDSSNDAPLSTITHAVICPTPPGTLESSKNRQLFIVAVGENGRVRSFSCHMGWQSAQKVAKLCADIETITLKHVRLDAENQLYYALAERINVSAPRSKLCVIAFEDTVYTSKVLIPENEVDKWRSDEYANKLNAKMQSFTFVIAFNTRSSERPADDSE